MACSLCKQEGHTKRTCKDAAKPVVTKVKEANPLSPEALTHVRAVLKKTNNFLLEKKEWYKFIKKSNDGRTDSTSYEHLVTDDLLSGLPGQFVKKATKTESEEENNRAYGDISIDLSKFGCEPFPCNVKIISKFNKSGNNSCGLTGLVSHTFKQRCLNHDEVAELLTKFDDLFDKGDTTFIPNLTGIIMCLKEEQKCWTGTLDEVPTKRISTNPANPLQVSFLSETDRVSRTYHEYISLLWAKIDESYAKRGSPAVKIALYRASKEAKKASEAKKAQ